MCIHLWFCQHTLGFPSNSCEIKLLFSVSQKYSQNQPCSWVSCLNYNQHNILLNLIWFSRCFGCLKPCVCSLILLKCGALVVCNLHGHFKDATQSLFYQWFGGNILFPALHVNPFTVCYIVEDGSLINNLITGVQRKSSWIVWNFP